MLIKLKESVLLVIDIQDSLVRLTASGVSVVTTEMVVFEWLGQAGTLAFKRLLPKIK